MKNPIRTIFGMAVILIAAACNDAECKNTNPIFNEQTPDTKEYQEELAKTLEADKTSKTVFILDRYEEKEGIPQLHMNVKRDGLCATAIVLVLNPDANFKNVQKVKGDGYAGAEFKDLKFKVFRDEAKTVLLYEGVSAIVD